MNAGLGLDDIDTLIRAQELHLAAPRVHRAAEEARLKIEAERREAAAKKRAEAADEPGVGDLAFAERPTLAQRAREAHEQALQSEDLKSSYIQFDEMQTFEHSAAKPLTIALAVRAKTGQILAAKVGRIPAKGHLASKGQSKYGWTTNEAHEVCKSVLSTAARVAKPGVTIGCDGGPTYPGYVASTFPKQLRPTVSAEPARGSAGGGFDPLFRLNHSCAKIRADLACMARKTWATTKKRSHLQHRLDLYVAVNNGYRLT